MSLFDFSRIASRASPARFTCAGSSRGASATNRRDAAPKALSSFDFSRIASRASPARVTCAGSSRGASATNTSDAHARTCRPSISPGSQAGLSAGTRDLRWFQSRRQRDQYCPSRIRENVLDLRFRRGSQAGHPRGAGRLGPGSSRGASAANACDARREHCPSISAGSQGGHPRYASPVPVPAAAPARPMLVTPQREIFVPSISPGSQAGHPRHASPAPVQPRRQRGQALQRRLHEPVVLRLSRIASNGSRSNWATCCGSLRLAAKATNSPNRSTDLFFGSAR